MPGAPTPKYGLATINGAADPVNSYPSVFNDVVGDIDALMATVNTEAPRPAAGKAGRIHIAGDGTVSLDLGAAWVVLAQAEAVAPVEIGVVQDFAGAALPDPAGNVEYAWADGGLIRSDVYTDFAARAGNAHNGGVSPGSGTPTQGQGGTGPLVRLPDVQGRLVVGKGTHADVNALGKTDAQALASRTVRHRHSVTDPGHAHTQKTVRRFDGASGVAIGYFNWGQDNNDATALATTGISVGLAGSNLDAPSHIVLNKIVRIR